MRTTGCQRAYHSNGPDLSGRQDRKGQFRIGRTLLPETVRQQIRESYKRFPVRRRARQPSVEARIEY
jgi:hypothetical protein